jgi:hypothetical protein
MPKRPKKIYGDTIKNNRVISLDRSFFIHKNNDVAAKTTPVTSKLVELIKKSITEDRVSKNKIKLRIAKLRVRLR